MIIVQWPEGGKIHVLNIIDEETLCGLSLEDHQWWQMGITKEVRGIGEICENCLEHIDADK